MKKEIGITLIALVITVIVLLILAGVTISTLIGENGLLSKAGDAKSQSEIAEEKDIISISVLQAQTENKQGNLEENNFSKALNQNSKEGNKASILTSDIESYTVKFQSNRYYEVDKNGNIDYIENVTGEKTLTVQCINSKNEVLGEYEYTIVTDKYSKLPPAIDKYESAEERIEGEITENKTIQVLYYLICNDDTTLVFTGLDSNGNITTNENEIVSYMIGDGNSTANGNGLKEKSIESIIIIPDTYKNKKVIRIYKNALSYIKNTKKVVISDTINLVDDYILYATNIEELTIGKNVSSLNSHAFMLNGKLRKVIIRSENINYSISPFHGSPNFKEIVLEENDDKYKLIGDIVFSKDEKTLLLCPTGKTGKYNVPYNTEKIKNGAFEYCNIEEVEIPDSVITMDDWIFYSCKNLKEVTIGTNIKGISGHTFSFCSELKNVIINSPDVVKKITTQTAQGNIINYAETIYIKLDITEIGSYITDNYQIVESDKEGYVKYVKL